MDKRFVLVSTYTSIILDVHDREIKICKNLYQDVCPNFGKNLLKILHFRSNQCKMLGMEGGFLIDIY